MNIIFMKSSQPRAHSHTQEKKVALFLVQNTHRTHSESTRPQRGFCVCVGLPERWPAARVLCIYLVFWLQVKCEIMRFTRARLTI